MPNAKIERYNGQPSIMIDGVPYPPMTMLVRETTGYREDQKDYFRRLGEAGLKIYYLSATTRWNRPGNPETGELDGISCALRDINILMDAVPDAWIILRLNVAPSAEWVNSHPEEQVRFSDGASRPVICTTVGKTVLDGMHSLCSKAWIRDADKALQEFFDELEQSPYFQRIVGFFLCAGGTSEWYYPFRIQTEDGAYADFSEPFRQEYEKFLREKYGTVEELRRVWKMPDATFENPKIPTFAEREYVFDVDKKITHALFHWEEVGRTVGVNVEMDSQEPVHFGVFLNANGYAHVADFYTAWHASTAHTIIQFGQILKKRYPNLLVGAFYGSFGCTSYFDGSTCSGTLRILDSGVVDFLAAPGVYNNREPGGVVAQREMQDSFRLRNSIYVCEDDSRTHRCKPWMQRDAMALYTVEDSINTLKRDFARDLCDDIQGWWFDMGGDWYDDDDIIDLFRRQQKVADYSYSLDRTKKNDIAVIYDAESVHYVSRQTSKVVVDFFRTSDLHRIGAPVDWYFHNDMERDDMPDYKLYIMLNVYHLTDAERDAIHAKAKRNGATVLWMYAPGFINPDAPRVMDVANIEKTIGMKVKVTDKTHFPHFRVDPTSHPILKGATASRRYGIIDRDVHSNVWIEKSVLPPDYCNPGFSVDDPEAVVLGRYCHNGEVSMAMTQKDGFTSVYCATPVLRSDMIASIAEYAGCHLFLHGDDVIYANENFVTIHAKDDGKRTIWFKKPCSPYEVYEKKFYGHNVDHIEVDLRLGETKMWSTTGEEF
ncbi:MAG: hypothetical protein J6B54_07380 [Clostridia bacterium]|nr:hypothetical protein [Clostridia bacterium]